MTQQIINVGGSTPNNGEGETLRSGAVKINENFSELYAAVGIGSNQTFVNSIIAGDGISVNAASGNVTITNSAPNILAFQAITVAGQSSVLASNNQALTLNAGSNVTLTTNPMTNVITIAATQQQADWNASSGATYIANKPSIPAAQVQSDWGQMTSSAVDYIKNKPAIPSDLSQLTDTTHILGANNYLTIVQLTASIDPSGTGVVYSSAAADIESGIKATILVIGKNGTGSYQSQLSEVLIARSFPDDGDPTVQLVVIGNAYTGGSALATFTAAWSSTDHWINVSATNLTAVTGNSIQVKVIATELRG